MRWGRRLWAAPTSLVGLLALPLALLSRRGGARRVDGVLELHGPAVAWLLALGGAGAVALGHVVLGRDAELLERSRTHERVHVRQAERWGPLFLPAYLAASVIAWARGGHYYRDNAFEIEAYAVSDPSSSGSRSATRRT